MSSLESFLEKVITGEIHPIWVALAVVLIIALIQSQKRSGQKDPTREFSSVQRRSGFERAGHRCEFTTWMLFRCTVTATHADHFYPHSKGGASSMRNLVAACARHNLSKGARLPTLMHRAQIQVRRRKYFPPGIDRTAGEWFIGGYR